MKTYFGCDEVTLYRAIDIVTLKLICGVTQLEFDTEFGRIIVELNRKKTTWKNRVETHTIKTAPMTNFVKRRIQSGFDYYITINFAFGVNLSNYEPLLRYFVAIGLCTAYANYVKRNSKYICIPDVRAVGEIGAYQYMISIGSCDVLGNHYAEMYAKSNSSLHVSQSDIQFLDEIFYKYKEELKSEIMSKEQTSILFNQVIYNNFWKVFIGAIVNDAFNLASNRITKENIKSVHDELQKTRYIESSAALLVLWIDGVIEAGAKFEINSQRKKVNKNDKNENKGN